MVDKQKPSRLLQVSGILWFILMSLGAIVYFAFSIIEMGDQLIKFPPSIVFERGAYYLLGAGLGIAALVTIGVIEIWTKVPPSAKATKIFIITAISSIALSLLLPIVAGYFIESYLLDNEYTICDVPSSAWLIYKDVIYTDNPETCTLLILSREEAIQGYHDSWK